MDQTVRGRTSVRQSDSLTSHLTEESSNRCGRALFTPGDQRKHTSPSSARGSVGGRGGLRPGVGRGLSRVWNPKERGTSTKVGLWFLDWFLIGSEKSAQV